MQMGVCRRVKHVVLQLTWLSQFQFAGYYAALEKGLYRDPGFKVTGVEGNPKLPQKHSLAQQSSHSRFSALLHLLFLSWQHLCNYELRIDGPRFTMLIPESDQPINPLREMAAAFMQFPYTDFAGHQGAGCRLVAVVFGDLRDNTLGRGRGHAVIDQFRIPTLAFDHIDKSLNGCIMFEKLTVKLLRVRQPI